MPGDGGVGGAGFGSGAGLGGVGFGAGGVVVSVMPASLLREEAGDLELDGVPAAREARAGVAVGVVLAVADGEEELLEVGQGEPEAVGGVRGRGSAVEVEFAAGLADADTVEHDAPDCRILDGRGLQADAFAEVARKLAAEVVHPPAFLGGAAHVARVEAARRGAFLGGQAAAEVNDAAAALLTPLAELGVADAIEGALGGRPCRGLAESVG